MYKIRLLKQIHACFAAASSEDAYVHKHVELPFPPYPGLNLLVDDMEISIHSRDRNEAHDGCTIYWDTKRKSFTVYTEADKELYRKGLEGGYTDTDSKESKARFIEIVKEYVTDGWELGDGDRKLDKKYDKFI